MAAHEADWRCVSCSTLNFARRSRCFQCRGMKARAGDWTCPKCNFLVFGSKAVCAKCGSANPIERQLPKRPVEYETDRPKEPKDPKVGFVMMHIGAGQVACVALDEHSSDVLATLITESLDAALDWALEHTNGRLFRLVASSRFLLLAGAALATATPTPTPYDFDDLMQRHTGSRDTSWEQTVARLEKAHMSKRLDRSGVPVLDQALDMAAIFKGMLYRGLYEKRISYI